MKNNTKKIINFYAIVEFAVIMITLNNINNIEIYRDSLSF